MSLDAATKTQIEELIQKNRVVLFMKGSKQFPQCGFSATVVNILKELKVPFETANVLADPALREGIKVYSDWPTIPQLYVGGEFLGGCDIVREMHATGELAKALGAEWTPPAPPKVRLSKSAAEAFRAAAEPGDDVLRLEIDQAFRVDLYFGPKKPGDFQIASEGVTIFVDAASAKRADGVSIDYVEGPDGAGFRVENPNAPASVKALGVKELAKMREAETVHLVDVRPEEERKLAHIAGDLSLEGEGRAKLDALPKDAPIVFYCHHGVRSLAAAQHYVERGFRRVYNLTGGVDAWSREIDPSLPRY